jgi:hypothetical protein
MPAVAPLKAAAPKPSHKAPASHPTVTASKPVAKAAPLPSFARTTLPARAPAASSGQPIAPHVQEALERSFAVDMSAIRVHTDSSAHSANKSLRARAHAFGSDIFLGQGEDAANLGLIAHEAAHVIQQQGLDTQHDAAAPQRSSNESGDRFEREADRASSAVQRGERFTVRERVGAAQAQCLPSLSDVLDYFADKAANIPGYTLFTVILGVNPINMDRVERSAANLLRGVIELVPGGHLLTQALKNSGVFEKAGDWVAEQFHKLGLVGASIRDALTSFRWRDLLHPSELWHKAKRIITDPIDKILSLVEDLVKDLIHFIKEAILKPVAKLAEGKPAYTLMRGVLGSDPISGEPVADQGTELLGGLMTLAGQEEAWENAKKANAIPRILSWFKKAMSELIGFVRDIPGMVIGAIKSLELTDLIAFPLALAKVAKVFGGFVLKFIEWGVRSVWHLLEIVFDVVSPGAFSYIKKTGAALKDILKHPIHFVRNLVSAAVHGFKNFASNIGTHLKTGLIDWLTGSLTGVYIPKALTLSEMGLFALSVLDLTWAQIRAKIVKALGANGETIMKGLETGFDVVVALVKGGTAAAWDLIKEKLTDLKDTVVDGIKGFVVDSIVKKAVPKLIAMFIPGAGFISAIISIYDTVRVFIDKLAKIVATVKAFLDSIVSIAEGRLEAAEQRVEDSLVGLLTLAINFLAGFLGLGKITDKIREILAKIRGTVDKALDAGVEWIVGKAKTVVGKLFGAAKGVAKGVVGKLLGWDDDKSTFEGEEGETHTVFVDDAGGVPTLKIASAPERAEDFLAKFLRKQLKADPDFKTRRKDEIKDVTDAIQNSQEAIKNIENKKKETDDPGVLGPLHTELRLRNVKLANAQLMLERVGKDGKKSEDKQNEVYQTECDAGTYGKMAGVTDHITPDHEPQDALMEAVASYETGRFKNIKGAVFKGSSGIAGYTKSAGVCMNMLDIRHKLTRTYRGAGGATKARALAMIDTALKGLDVTATADSVRTTIGHVVRKELQEDQSVVESIYSQSSVPAETRKKASKGMADVRTLNKGRWPDLLG